MKRKLIGSLISIVAVVGLAAACTPPAPGGGLPTKKYEFKGTQVTVNNSQDETCILICVNTKDEPFLLNVGFQVTIGKKDSAEAWVVNNRNSAPQDVAPGTTVQVTDAGSPVVFTVKPVDLLDLANPANKLTVFGTFTWAAEQDTTGLGMAANATADMLKDGLNATLAKGSVAGLDAQLILDLVLNNIDSALAIGFNGLGDIDFGLGDINDDALGGGIYIGIGARGTLGSALNALIPDVTIPPIDIPIVDTPPPIDHIGIYTMEGSKTWTHTFNGQDGEHTWVLKAGPTS